MEAEPLPENVEDRIEALLALGIAVFEREGQAGVERICQENPGVADELRARLSWLLDKKMIAAPDCPATTGLSGVFAKLGGAAGMHLEPEGSDGPPVKVTEEVRRLRDPSGRYQFLGEIGRGGIGVVYKGRDTDLGRDVAMKMLRDEYAGNVEALSRFVEEAQIGGQLQHPGIVPVYDVGLQAGDRPYFAMKLIKGKTLAAQLAERGDPSTDRRRLLGVFEQVCQTMAYAHTRRVVHRDLKPANVMIGAFGEVQVVDWGLAKVLQKDVGPDERERRATTASVIQTVRSREGSESAAGSVLGTPAYMPPEQALGEIDLLDQRSDVFGLGAILCEILTGEPPYREQDGDVLRQAATAALRPAKERLAGCGADRALVELCVECLAPAREARLASAQELAGRMSAYLTSVEERARQAELRAAEARYRQRTTMVASAAAILILAVGGGAWIWQEDAAKALSEAHSGLGIVLRQQGNLDDAIASFGRAVEFDPRNASAHLQLASALHDFGQPDGAIASYEQALDINPKDAGVHINIGSVLLAQGRYDKAIDRFERALLIDRDLAEAHFNLGVTLHAQGKLEKAVASYQRAQEILGKRSGTYASRFHAQASEQIARLQATIDRRVALDEVLNRQRSARSPEEWAAAIRLAYDGRRFRQIVEITEATLRDAAELTDDGSWGLYNSACAAGLCAADGANGIDFDERARIRTLARSWLGREVERWQTAIRDASATATEARKRLAHALKDADFVSVRADALTGLAPAERTAWQTLWTSIEEALKQAAR